MHTRLEDALAEMFQELLETPEDPARTAASDLPSDRRLQLAGTALMICVVRADNTVRQDEHRALEKAVGRTLGVTPDRAARIVRVVEEHFGDEVPFYRFVRLLDEGCSIEEKKRVVESLWRVAFADAELQSHEEYLVRKVAENLHLSTADLVETKVRAREAFLAEDI